MNRTVNKSKKRTLIHVQGGVSNTIEIGSMKILYIGTLPLHPGGTAIVGYQLVLGFARQGNSVCALAPTTPETLEKTHAFDFAHPEVRIIRFEMRHYELHPFFPY